MPLPSTSEKTYFTTSADQKRMKLEIVQYLKPGENEISLGNLVIGPLPSVGANYPIDVKIESRKDGTVWFKAIDNKTGVEIEKIFGDDEVGSYSLLKQRALVSSTTIIGSL